MQSGVYRITHVASGRCYIGSAADLARRWKRHRLDLARGGHHSPYLQRAWTKYGDHAFSFEVLEQCDPAHLIVREQQWMDALRPKFNVLPTAGSMLGAKRGAAFCERMSEATKAFFANPENRAAMSARTRARWADPEYRLKMLAVRQAQATSETRAKVSAAVRLLWADPTYRQTMQASRKSETMKGHPVSTETRAKIRAANLGKVRSAETRARIGRAHLGKTLSTETRAKLSDELRRRWADPAYRGPAVARLRRALEARWERARA